MTRRDRLLGAFPDGDRFVQTRELAARASLSVPESFRELSKLRGEGVVELKSAARVGGVSWRRLPEPDRPIVL